MTAASPLEALAAELGASAGRFERELRLQFELGMAQMRELMESLRRQAGEMAARALVAEQELRDAVQQRLAEVRNGDSVTVDDVRPLIEERIARGLAETPPVVDPHSISAAVVDEVSRQLPRIAVLAAEMIPERELPDIGALVAEQVERREEDIAKRAAAMVPVTEVPNVASAAEAAAEAAVQRQLPEIARQASAWVLVPELPDVGALVDNAVAAAFSTVPMPRNGRDADPEIIAAMVRAHVDEAIDAMPPPPTQEEQRSQIESVVMELVALALGELPEPKNGESVTVDDFKPVIESEIARQLTENPVPLDDVAVSRIVAMRFDAELASRLPEIARQAATFVEGPQVPDVAAAVAAELSRRQDEIVAQAALLTLRQIPEQPELPDIPAMVEKTVDAAIARIPPPKDGDPGPTGSLPKVEEWQDRVHYQSEVVTLGGSLFQALRDTGYAPPHNDWLCIVAARESRALRIRGTYSTDTDYEKLDVVMVNNSSFVAKRDNPGLCPGDDWQLLAGAGKPGKPGMSIKGDRGPPGQLLALQINDDAVLEAVNADGSRVSCDLYPVLQKLER